MYEEIPPKSGKEFEEDIMRRGKFLEKQGVMSLGRYGVLVSLINGEWKPTPSYPDLEGDIAPDGRHFIAEAKVVSSSSFKIAHEDHFKESQKKHLYRRSKVGAACFLIIHFNQRELKKCTILQRTYAVPVHPELPLWKDLEAGKISTISPESLEEYGAIVVNWTPCGSRGRLLTPEIEPLFDYKYAID